jgi:hypothetical protein
MEKATWKQHGSEIETPNKNPPSLVSFNEIFHSIIYGQTRTTYPSLSHLVNGHSHIADRSGKLKSDCRNCSCVRPDGRSSQTGSRPANGASLTGFLVSGCSKVLAASSPKPDLTDRGAFGTKAVAEDGSSSSSDDRNGMSCPVMVECNSVAKVCFEWEENELT